ncbi:N-carbamoyl-L-amino acid amidohydrolase [Bacillus sp. FJAT-18017]|uniref:M20 family metallo-hydrolase n=1 Tax=Bacillus sp. FJAT-18017 TaxID=1705566 RepID=UPI0006B066C4|nr:M20 family metallo-hydrolase [Bacillus sp. FJAT-18017]ALC91396.1 N-carbamoyl-L-amino acid amidohydrolase [Bacillus sp. FJAT-18017]
MDKRKRYETLLAKINQYNSGQKGITRIAYSNEEQACTHALMRMCKDARMSVKLDNAGNLIARRDGKNNTLPPVVIGSHIDSVYDGGKYDGVVGVAAGLEIINRLNDRGITTEHPIELISFACEESARFGVATLGSKAMAGRIDKGKYRTLKDRDGITIEKAFSLCALDFDSINEAHREKENFKAFFEMHIEQGPVLETEQKKIGIVTGIAAPARFIVTISGKASHSGTTPMDMRQDALLGAAEIALELEKAAKKEADFGTVATVGVLAVHPGAMNVIPGEVEMKIDIRSSSLESRHRVLDRLHETLATVQKERQLGIDCKEISLEEPVLLSEEICGELAKICEEKQLPYRLMQSGAGHDAMNMTGFGPVGLVFIPSVDGLSHHPNEHTDFDDIMLGIDVLEEAVLCYAKVSSSSLEVGGQL